jgi:hypothetical protein
MDAELSKIYQHYSFVSPIVDEDIFQEYFKPTGRTLVVSSPNLLALCKRKGIQPDYLKCGKENPLILSKYQSQNGLYDTVIGDFEDKSPSHAFQTIHDSSYMHYLRDGFDRHLKDNGKIICKLPLVALRYFSEKNKKGIPYYLRMNITKLFIHSSDNYIIVEIEKKEYCGKTIIQYNDSHKVINCNIHETILYPSYNEEIFSLIQSYLKDSDLKDYEHYERLGGPEIKRGLNLEIREKYNDLGLVMYTNSKKIKFDLLESATLTSSSIIYIFEDKNTRNEYYQIINKKEIVDLISSLSYNNTIPHNIIPFVLHPATVEYAKSL